MHLGARGAAQHAAFLENVAEGRCDDPASGALGRLPPGGGVLTLPDSMLCVDSELSGWVYDGSEQTVRAAATPIWRVYTRSPNVVCIDP